MREVVDVLERLGERRRERFSRAFVPQQVAPPMAPLALSLAELFAAVDRVLRVARDPVIHDVVPRALDVDGAITTIRAVLALRARARWRDVVAAQAAPWEVLSALLALLELARRGELRLAQPGPFKGVEITRDDRPLEPGLADVSTQLADVAGDEPADDAADTHAGAQGAALDTTAVDSTRETTGQAA
jgi:segregation and condensation protein A